MQLKSSSLLVMAFAVLSLSVLAACSSGGSSSPADEDTGYHPDLSGLGPAGHDYGSGENGGATGTHSDGDLESESEDEEGEEAEEGGSIGDIYFPATQAFQVIDVTPEGLWVYDVVDAGGDLDEDAEESETDAEVDLVSRARLFADPAGDTPIFEALGTDRAALTNPPRTTATASPKDIPSLTLATYTPVNVDKKLTGDDWDRSFVIRSSQSGNNSKKFSKVTVNQTTGREFVAAAVLPGRGETTTSNGKMLIFEKTTATPLDLVYQLATASLGTPPMLSREGGEERVARSLSPDKAKGFVIATGDSKLHLLLGWEYYRFDSNGAMETVGGTPLPLCIDEAEIEYFAPLGLSVYDKGKIIALTANVRKNDVQSTEYTYMFLFDYNDGVVSLLCKPMNGSYITGQPGISPDGRFAFFTAGDPNLPGELYVLDLNGTRPLEVKRSPILLWGRPQFVTNPTTQLIKALPERKGAGYEVKIELVDAVGIYATSAVVTW